MNILINAREMEQIKMPGFLYLKKNKDLPVKWCFLNEQVEILEK